MDAPAPFCEECGTLGPMLSGTHPGNGGVVRWAIYRCGHMKTEIALDEVPLDEAELLPAATEAL